ncbi:MAG: IS1634 family transposase [Comamonadaceae bacterium]|nr:IS1634 family transposase [Comamonadaceae bacterium]
MYVRRTQTRSTATGETYFTYRLVRSERHGQKVRAVTVMNLGRHFPVPQEHWPAFCARIEELSIGQVALLPMDLPASVEAAAQRYGAFLLARQAAPAEGAGATETAATADVQSVDVDSLELTRPRSVGVEQVALWAMQTVGLIELLIGLGLSGPLRSVILGVIIGRIAYPASERATRRWLEQRSGLGELLEVDFEALGENALYRASDALMKHRSAIEDALFSRVSDLFGLTATVTLYDLTNTYFEGEASVNPKAANGPSKEKRTDCPLVTLGLVLDGSGFVRRSECFEGNVAEGKTLAGMLQSLGAPSGALVVMDRGLSSEENLAWLRTEGYRYLVVSRERERQFDPQAAMAIETAGGDPIQLQLVREESGQEVRLYCYSKDRAAKEDAISRRFTERFEAGLQKIAEGLAKPRGEKRLAKLNERIGRLKEKCRGVGQHYRIELVTDETGQKATALNFDKQPREGSRLTHPGVYCLRSNETTWDAEQMWRTFTMLTDLESVFRSLKSELGLRPVFHHKENRVDGHLFISVLAYQFVQIIRRRLKEQGICDRWSTLRETLGVNAESLPPSGEPMAAPYTSARRPEPNPRPSPFTKR